MMTKFRTYPLAVLALAVSIAILTGCSGSSEVAPVEPENEVTISQASGQTGSSENRQWGTWVLRCTDPEGDEPAKIESIPIRSGMVHLDVGNMLMPPSCVNCFDAIVMGVQDNVWTVHVDLTNPTAFTAYDVRGVFPAGAEGPEILEPDSYTSLFDIDGNSATSNPYLVFNTGDANRAWGPGETHGKSFMFSKTGDQKFTELVYVVAVSWPENQEDVTQLINPNASGPLYTDASNYVDFEVEVLDWQDNVEYVLIDLSPVGGSPYTHMESIGNDIWQFFSYSEYGLETGTFELLIAAKSGDSDAITYNYLTVSVIEPPPPSTDFELLSGPVTLDGIGAPSGVLDLSVVGTADGTSSSFVLGSSTEIYEWDEDYSSAGLYLTLIDSTGTDPDFPIDPVTRLALTDPVDPSDPSTFSILQINSDSGVLDDSVTPSVLYRHILQLLDMDQLQVTDFRLTTDNADTDELDAILRPADVSAGVGDDRYGYALWVPDSGQYPAYYPYAALVRYEPPYKDGVIEYDTIIGGINEGPGEGNVDKDDVTGLAVWDGNGQSDLLVVVSEGDGTDEVEFFRMNYTADPGGMFTQVTTLSGLVGSPLDVAILPVGDAGYESGNWVCILTDSRTIEIYTEDGDFVESIVDGEAIPVLPRHLDVDTENLRIHVLMDGPRASVFEYTG